MNYLLIICLVLAAGLLQTGKDKYTALREKMVEEQIAGRGITDKATLSALRKVPRHLFVPPDMASYAYDDNPLPIGYGQTISQPYIVALMTQVSNPEPRKKALEIGTGSGYQTAILAEIIDSVFTVEIVPELAKQSADLFRKLGYKNIISKYGDGYRGWKEHAPYDIIIVTAAPEDIPQPLLDQLAENGRLVIPVGGPYSFQDLVLAEKKHGKIIRQRIASVRFVPFRRL